MIVHLSDQELVAQIGYGNSECVTQLYDRHIRLAWSLIVRIVRDPSESEDVVQELFVRVWQQARAYDPARGDVIAWLCQMARTMAIDRLRSMASRNSREKGYGEQQESDALLSLNDEINPDWPVVRRALAELPDDQRSLIEGAYFDGLSQSELSERYGIPLGTVKTRVRQGMIRLRSRLIG